MRGYRALRPGFAGAECTAKSLAEFRARRREKIKIVFPGGAPQGGFSCPSGAIHLLYVGKTPSGLPPEPSEADPVGKGGATK